MTEKSARIISLVPSWTETFVSAGLNVVGRTRYCIHPAGVVDPIAKLGGTKQIDFDQLLALKPDVVVLDREENKKVMAEKLEAAGIKILVSHVSDLKSAADFLDEAGRIFGSEILSEMGLRYLRLLNNPESFDFEKFFRECVLVGDLSRKDLERFEYVIWNKPFMVIGKNTFIADVLSLVGLKVEKEEKYPEMKAEELKEKFCLFSSEPFPFATEYSKLKSLGYRGVVVDGEKISWYGIRNLSFLEKCQK